MIKKINISQLRCGMYVHDFNCGWLDHPFLSKKITIKSPEMLRKVLTLGIKELYIDTAKGQDVELAPTINEADSELTSDMNKTIRKGESSGTIDKKVEYEEEIENVKEVKNRAKET